MSDPSLLLERLHAVVAALERIPRRFAGISQPSDFLASDDGIDRMDAICMILIAVGEEFKRIDLAALADDARFRTNRDRRAPGGAVRQ